MIDQLLGEFTNAEEVIKNISSARNPKLNKEESLLTIIFRYASGKPYNFYDSFTSHLEENLTWAVLFLFVTEVYSSAEIQQIFPITNIHGSLTNKSSLKRFNETFKSKTLTRYLEDSDISKVASVYLNLIRYRNALKLEKRIQETRVRGLSTLYKKTRLSARMIKSKKYLNFKVSEL